LIEEGAEHSASPGFSPRHRLWHRSQPVTQVIAIEPKTGTPNLMSGILVEC